MYSDPFRPHWNSILRFSTRWNIQSRMCVCVCLSDILKWSIETLSMCVQSGRICAAASAASRLTYRKKSKHTEFWYGNFKLNELLKWVFVDFYQKAHIYRSPSIERSYFENVWWLCKWYFFYRMRLEVVVVVVIFSRFMIHISFHFHII